MSTSFLRRVENARSFGTRNDGAHVVARAAIGLVLAVVLAGSAASPAIADPPEAATPGAVRAAHISTVLDGVPLTGAAYAQAVATTERVRADLQAAEQRLADANQRIETLTVERGRLETRITEDEAIEAAAKRRITSLRTQLRHLALQAYVGADDLDSTHAALTLDTESFLEVRTVATTRRAVSEGTHERLVDQLAIASAARQRLDSNRARLTRTVAELASSDTAARDARQAIDQGKVDLLDSTVRLRDIRATARVEGTDLPLVALDAYVRGALIAQLVTPGCHLHWSLLAGIGKVESGQGTHGGAAVRQDGTVTRPIIGVPLDGTNGNESITLPGGGHMRAEGPMQFLPSTWASVAVDGDDDGRTDIQNLYDAAATAGAYLCRNGVDTATEAGLRRAILTYNFSGEYVAKVTREMTRYAEALPNVPPTTSPPT